MITITIRLYSGDAGEFVDSCDISKWKVLAGKLDWSQVADLPDFTVTVDYGSGFDWKLVDVRTGRGNHIVSIDDGSPERVVPVEAIIPTVRLFVTCQVARKKLLDCDGCNAPVSMTIRPT